MYISASCYTIIFILLTAASSLAISNETSGDGDSIWKRTGKMTGILLNNCFRSVSAKSPEQFIKILEECVKRRSLLALDRVINKDVIDIVDGVVLVRYREWNNTRNTRYYRVSENNSKADEDNWKNNIIERLEQLFHTHTLKIYLKRIDEAQIEARGRHKQNMFAQIMMFGLLAAGLIVVPMGFQFLAIIGGKALLLAKMALLMTSIQGLKKIATSNVNYGLYSTHGQGPWQYDRQWPYEQESQGIPHGYNNYNGYSEFIYPRNDLMYKT